MSAVLDDRQARMAFLKIDEQCRADLRDLRGIVEREIDGVLDGFYRHVLGIQGLRDLVGTGADRIKGLQRQHWLRLFSGKFDEEYYTQLEFALSRT